MLRQGSGEPLVLLHGVLRSERSWSHVVALLATRHDVIVPTALGHNGGHPVTERPTSMEHIIDDAERLLDELGLEQAHLAGSSMGGWMAIELARRGRARSVCALSPAGVWDGDWEDKQRVFELLSTAVRDTRRSRAKLPELAQSGDWRRQALRYAAVHGERVSPAEYLALADDVIGCEIAEDLSSVMEAQIAPLDPPPCPITLAWAAEDLLFPVDLYGTRARELIPGARFIVLDDVGHVPMFDDPQLVAETILAVTVSG
ncbi:MAG: alpha/beta fold hydrolase [Solirubrobacteraceae bacterium]|jgi:pimeloyl-ACP methyl ester carboxylesterase